MLSSFLALRDNPLLALRASIPPHLLARRAGMFLSIAESSSLRSSIRPTTEYKHEARASEHMTHLLARRACILPHLLARCARIVQRPTFSTAASANLRFHAEPKWHGGPVSPEGVFP